MCKLPNKHQGKQGQETDLFEALLVHSIGPLFLLGVSFVCSTAETIYLNFLCFKLIVTKNFNAHFKLKK